ncbi:hypothetical protein GGI07_000987 [Coemansia sp. Benny D115]|nr:hypothetical protein GGI07_000987 [Coemansia sp. Benny D115]
MLITEATILGFAYTAVKALLEVFLIGFSGYIFARNGTLTKSTLKSLSIISVNLMTPALLFSKMTETLDPALLVELWNEPVFYFIYGGFSLLWSRTGSRMLGLNAEYARLCDVATFFSNTNTLPVSLIKSIALSSGSQFLLKDANDTPLKVAARGVSYAMIFATLNNILRWSFGVALMGGVGAKNKSAFNSVNASPRSPAPMGHTLPESPALVASGSAGAPMLRRELGISNGGHGGNVEDDELTPLYLGAPAQPLRSRRQSLMLRVGQIWESVQAGITPPVYAIAAAFLVIIIKPLHRAVMDPSTVLNTIWSAIDMCGDACVPLILISLGGQLGVMARDTQANQAKARGEFGSVDSTRAPSTAHLVESSVPSIILRQATGTESEASGTARGSRLLVCGSPDNENDAGDIDDDDVLTISEREQRRGTALVLTGRFIFVPTMAIILISVLRIFFPRWLPIMATDPVYILTLLILSGTPPAINLITVSQATGKFEKEAAQILFYGYVLGIFVLALEVAGFLWLTSILTQM